MYFNCLNLRSYRGLKVQPWLINYFSMRDKMSQTHFDAISICQQILNSPKYIFCVCDISYKCMSQKHDTFDIRARFLIKLQEIL